MNFSESISSCFSKYATFSGRASRSEFWWFYLFTLMLQGGTTIVGGVEALITNQTYLFDIFPIIASLVTAIPTLAVSCRRLHDIDKSGWWILIMFTIIGIIPLIIWWSREAKDQDNRFGVVPNRESLNKTKNEININKKGLKTTTNKRKPVPEHITE